MLLTVVTSSRIGRKPSSYLNQPDGRKPETRADYSKKGEIYRELENDRNETDLEIESSTNALINTTTYTTTNMEVIYISRTIFGATIALGATAVLLSIVSWVFVYAHRNNSLIAIGQPPCKHFLFEYGFYGYP